MPRAMNTCNKGDNMRTLAYLFLLMYGVLIICLFHAVQALELAGGIHAIVK